MSQIVGSLNSALSAIRSGTAELSGSSEGLKSASVTLRSAVDGLTLPDDPGAAVSAVTNGIRQSSTSFNQSAGSVTNITNGIGRISGAIGAFTGSDDLAKIESTMAQATNAVRQATSIAGEISRSAKEAEEIIGFLGEIPAEVQSAFDSALEIFGLESKSLSDSITEYTDENSILSIEVTSLISENVGGNAIDVNSKWTILDENGTDIIEFTSFFEADITNDGSVATYPQENGGFSSYNKVESPLNIRVILGQQGQEEEFGISLAKLDKFKLEAVKLFVVTPAKTYENMTLESYHYRRSIESGARILIIELSLLEIRNVQTQVLSTAAAWSPRNDTSATMVDGGLTQTSSAAYDFFIR